MFCMVQPLHMLKQPEIIHGKLSFLGSLGARRAIRGVSHCLVHDLWRVSSSLPLSHFVFSLCVPSSAVKYNNQLKIVCFSSSEAYATGVAGLAIFDRSSKRDATIENVTLFQSNIFTSPNHITSITSTREVCGFKITTSKQH